MTKHIEDAGAVFFVSLYAVILTVAGLSATGIVAIIVWLS